MIATVADAAATAKLKAQGAKAGDAFDMEVGGLADPSAGEPVRIRGAILKALEGYGQFWVSIKFGRDNVLTLSRYLVQILDPFSLNNLGVDIDAFQITAIKSRVHFRRGFHDNGFASTILLVEPTEPFLGTVRLDKLPYENVDLKQYYSCGNPVFPGQGLSAASIESMTWRLDHSAQIVGLIYPYFNKLRRTSIVRR